MNSLNGRYEIEKRLSKKGAYLANDRNTCRKVILKNSTAFDNTSFEYEILKEINHENMPFLIDSFNFEGDFYFAENYIDGISLDKYFKDNKKIDFDEILGISIMVARLLGFLHKFKKPIVHGDITPRNLLINNRKNIFLIDFSSSIFLEYILYKDFKIQGTFNFFSPEQVLIKKNIGLFSDIYGMGALISYMLKESGKTMALELSVIAEKAMEIRPEKRFESMDQLICALESI